MFRIAAITTPHLTPAELRVAHAMRRDKTVAAAAAELHLSPNTVKALLHAVYRKAGVSTRSEFLAEIALGRIWSSRRAFGCPTIIRDYV